MYLGTEEESEMKKEPMVKIILPCYNHEKYVRESIESVLAQTYQNFELLLFDNGSTDRSRDIIKEYEDRATVFYLEKNDLARVRNIWQQESRGMYYAFMTSDDIWMPDKLEKQINYLEGHPEYQACFTWAEYGDENMNILLDYTYTLYKQENRTNAGWLKYFCEKGNCLCSPSMVMKSENLLEITSTCFVYWQLSDLEQWVRFLLKGWQFYIYPEVLVKMRKHNQAVSYSDYSIAAVLEEESSLLVEIIEKMSDEMFCECFGESFLRAGCKSHEEILCEKILYLFCRAEKKLSLQSRAFDFLFKHFSDDNVEQTLSEKYNMPRAYFAELSKEIGTMNIFKYGYRQGKEEVRKEM